MVTQATALSRGWLDPIMLRIRDSWLCSDQGPTGHPRMDSDNDQGRQIIGGKGVSGDIVSLTPHLQVHYISIIQYAYIKYVRTLRDGDVYSSGPLIV